MYDTIIVGAGSAGCVLANRLSADPARKVPVLEAGRAAPRNADIPANWPLMLNTEFDRGFHTVPQAGCRGRRMCWPRRVHGTQGLYVAGASVFPSMVSGNTNEPTMMVAERAAEFILKDANR